MFADVEQLLVSYLAPLMGVRVCTELPADLASVLPVVQVERIAGPDLVPSIDQPVVDVEYFAVDRVTAKRGADAVRVALRFGLAGSTVNGVTVAKVETVQGPGWRPYDNTTLRRVGATYRITLHNHQ